MSGFAGFEPLRRNRWFTDSDGAMATSCREDEIIPWSWDWTDSLDSGVTVSSAAYVDSGTARTGTALVGNVTSALVAGLGEFECTVTLSSGEKRQRVFRFLDAAGGAVEPDYQG